MLVSEKNETAFSKLVVKDERLSLAGFGITCFKAQGAYPLQRAKQVGTNQIIV
jgi:hypothetical protein